MLLLDKRLYELRDVAHAAAVALVTEQHYAGGASRTAVHRHGLFRLGEPELLGVAMWMPPTPRAGASVSSDWRSVLCLSRLVVDPSVPKNGASFLLGRSIRLIRHDPRWRTLLTYADEAQGHNGGIYRATNWQYLGTTKSRERWIDPATGRQVALKATVSRTKPMMRELGYIERPGALLHKYVMHLG